MSMLHLRDRTSSVDLYLDVKLNDRTFREVALASERRPARDSVTVFIDQWQAARPDLDPWPLAILGRVERLSARLQRQAEGWLRPLGLTWESFCLIITLRRVGPPFALRPTDLYRDSLLSSGATTNRIDRVEEAGWVCRQPDPSDGRGVIVMLTEAGQALADRAIALHFESLAGALSGLTPAERTTLITLLTRALSDLEDDA
jgi:DNA-binding MarR family transcriptional regulator